MATLKGEVFGKIRGKIGKLVARTVNGKTVISERPDHYKETTSEEAKKVRNRFTIAVEFSSYINAIEILKAAWNQKRKKHSSVFNMLQSYNMKWIGEEAPSLNNKITPPFNIDYIDSPLLVNNLFFEGKEISWILMDLDQLKFLPAGREYFLVFVILYYEPNEKNYKYFVLDNFIFPLNINQENTQVTVITENPVSKYYNKAVIYSATVAVDTKNNKYYSSDTSASQFIIGKFLSL